MMNRAITWCARHSAGTLLVLFLIAVLTRIPSLAIPVIDTDEAMYANAARGLLRGLTLYRDVVDSKPPLIFPVYALLLAVVNDLRFVHLATIIVVWGTAVALARTVARSFDEKSGVVAGILYLIFVACIGQSSNAEIFMNLPIVLGAYCGLAAPPSQRRAAWLAAAGFLIGVASLIKQQAIVAIVPIAVVAIIPRIRAHRLWLVAEWASLACGMLLPYALTAWYFHSAGTLAEAVHWAYRHNLQYVQRGPTAGFAGNLARSLLIAVVISNLILWWYAFRSFFALRNSAIDTRERVALFFGALWLIVSCFAVTMGGRYYTHYFLQLTPVLVFLAAPPLTKKLMRFAELPSWQRTALSFMILAPLIGHTAFFSIKAGRGNYGCQHPDIVAASAFAALHTSPEERIFVWGSPIPAYLANRQDAYRAVNRAFAFENRDPCHMAKAPIDADTLARTPSFDLMMGDLAREKPSMLLDASPTNIQCWGSLPLEKFEPLRRFVHEGYVIKETIGNVRIYERGAPRP